MRAQPTLPKKIFFLAFLNLLLLALAVVIFASIEFRFQMDSLLMIPAQGRISEARDALSADLEQAPAQQRNAILQRYSDAYGVRFLLTDNQANPIGGPAMQLPGELRERIVHPGGARPDPPPPRPSPKPEFGGPPGPAREPRPPPNPPLFLVTSRNPVRYWVGERMPIRSAEDAEPTPGVLLLVSSSLFANAFFFDVKPWLLLLAAAIGLSVLCWLPFIRGLTRSIRAMSEATSHMAAGRFDIQLPERRRDELGKLSSSINRMAAQLQGFVKGQKRFLGDIAHELCAPVARLQFALGILEQRAGADPDRHIVDLQDEVQHMSGLVNELLSFSKAGMQGAEVQLVRVNVTEVVDRVLAREKAVHIQVNVDSQLAVLADPDALFRSLSNLIRNAIRYAGDAGPIAIAGQRRNGHVYITVSDSGPGLPDDALVDIFKPFYRPEQARTRESGGTGLGLAIVKTCVEACRGSVVARNRQPSGLEVEIRLAAA